MKTAQLIELLKQSQKDDFIKDYYGQVKDGLKESNTNAWRFFFVALLIVILYFAFSNEIINKIKLSQVILDNWKQVVLLAPVMFSFCYFLTTIHLIRYRNLLIHYDAITYHLSGIATPNENKDFLNEVLPMNFVDFILDQMYSDKPNGSRLLSFFIFLPITLIPVAAITFIVYTLWNIPYCEIKLPAIIVAILSSWLTFSFVYMGWSSKSLRNKDREALNDYIKNHITKEKA